MAERTEQSGSNWPNFVVVGAGRSGTTSIYYYLAEHPEVFVSPVKETNYFAYQALRASERASVADRDRARYKFRTREEYLALFRDRGDAKAVGEASPMYLSVPGTAEAIRRAIPGARIIAVLRDPAERAFSGYLKYVREGQESRSFSEAIEDERAGRNPESYRGNWRYLHLGFYGRLLRPYFELFPHDQITVLFFEDFTAAPEATMTELFRFLGVDDGFTPDCSVRYNPSGVPRSRGFERLLRDSAVARIAKRVLLRPERGRWLAPIIGLQNRNLRRPELAPEMRQQLIELYRPDVVALQELVGRDLQHWLR